MTRRSILITTAVLATGLVAWTKGASLLDKCCKLRRRNVTQLSKKAGQLPAHFHRRDEHGPNSEYRLALTPAQLERAHAAMESLYGDCCLLGRKL